MQLLIAGGGIGGLTTALVAQAAGFEPLLCEQADALSDIGAGLQLSPNAMRVMRALGLEAALQRTGFEPEAAQIRNGRSGELMAQVPLGAAAVQRWGAPYLHVHRADLVRVLSEALEARAPQSIRLGTAFTAYAQSAARLTLNLANGQTLEGDALVAADGLQSPLQAQMLGRAHARDTEQMAWRATVPVEALPDKLRPPRTACVWIGRGRHAVTYYVRGGALVNLVGVVERANDANESWSATGSSEDAARDFGGWHETIASIIGAAGTLHRWKLYDRPPLARWIDGRAALLGDACHPMLPFMAQGAAMAIEDAFVLVKCLASGADVPAALQKYEALRRPRATRVQAASAANRARFHQHTALSQLAPMMPARLTAAVSPVFMAGALDWLYGHDVTA